MECAVGCRALGLATGLVLATLLVAPAGAEPPAPLFLGTMSPAAAPEPWDEDAASHAAAVIGAGDLDDVLFERAGAPPVLDPRFLSLTTSVRDREAFDLRTFLTGGERWHLLDFGTVASSRPLGTKVTVAGQIPYVANEPAGAPASVEYPDSPGALRVTAEAGDFAVGAEYRSVGKRLERVITQPAWKDREGGEAWVAQRLGWVRLRLSRSDLTDNVERNPALPRTTREQTALTAEVASPAWPVLGLTYAAGDTERVRLTGDPRPAEGQEFESLTASAYHAGTRWSVAASSTYSEIRDVLRPDAESATMYHDLSLELRLLDSVSVVPAITVGQERYEDSVQSDTGSGSLTVGYDPPRQRWRASTTLTYTMNRTSDGLADGRGVSASGALAWKLGKLLGRPVTLTFEAGHDRYRDRLYSGASSQSVFGFVLVQFPAF